MGNLLEALMIVCFGISWPISIHKSWTSRTAKGKSITFEFFIMLGYVFGIIRKFLQLSEGGTFGFLFYLAFAFYFINLAMILFDMCLWVRNRALDAKADRNN